MVVSKEQNKEQIEWQPRIVGFFCRWCSYQGADLAGISRIDYPPTTIIIKVPCSGRVDPTFVLKSFAEGADGVLIAGCHPGDCHYIEGNYKAMRRYELLKKTLEQMGIDERRFRLEWISASEALDFARVITEMTKTLTKLGPIKLPTLSPIPKEED
ncbi:MAG: hydrogenase iron-sulfur subunit [Candidatus Heimdallarchaeaceae archaeon]